MFILSTIILLVLFVCLLFITRRVVLQFDAAEDLIVQLTAELENLVSPSPDLSGWSHIHGPASCGRLGCKSCPSGVATH